MTSPAARSALERLLLALFKGTELQRHAATLADDEDVEEELPQGAGRADLAHRLVEAMESRGLIDNAFFSRLTGLRERRADDISQVAALWTKAPQIGLGSASAGPKAVHNLPLQALDFIGRDDELARIHKLMASDQSVAISQPTSVSGLGGIGKTQLALRYALLHADEFDAVLWVDAAGDDITPAFAALDKTLRLSIPSTATVDERATAVREALEAGGRKLLVLDNVDHFKAIKAHLPRRGPTRVLMTTRLPDLPGAKALRLDVLPPEEALRVMLGDREVTGPELTAARDLCAELEYLTLALAVAREVLRSGLRTHRSLLDEIRQRGSVPWSEGVDTDVEDSLGKHPSLVRLFDASVALLDPSIPRGRGAIAMLEVGGWFAPAPIDLGRLMKATKILTGRARISEADVLADTLAKAGLATCDAGTVMFHRIIGAYGRSRGGSPARQAVVAALGDLFTLAPFANLARFVIYRHVRATTKWHRRRRGNSSAFDDDESWDWIPVKELQALKVSEERTQMEDAQAGFATRKLALLWSSSDPPRRETDPADEGERAAADQVGMANSLKIIGDAVFGQGKSTSAQIYYDLARAIMPTRSGANLPQTAITPNAVRQALVRQRRFAEVLGYEDRDLTITEKALGTEHPDRVSTLRAIVQALTHQGKYAEASNYCRASLAIYEETLGIDHPSTAITCATFALLLRDAGDIPRAREMFAKAMEVLNRRLGPEHPTTLAVRAEAEDLDH
jgi:tetratricopeptide (TPR) repeat protein